VVEVEASRHQNLLQVVPPVRDGPDNGSLNSTLYPRVFKLISI